MEHVLYIKWETGHMEIYMDVFFPCTKAKFNKLLKIIELDWAHRDELRETLKVYFQERILHLPEEAEELRRKAAEHRKEAAKFKEELKRDKEKRKRLGLAPDEFSYYTPYANSIAMAQELERKAKRLEKSKPNFEGYLKLIS